MRSDLCAEAIRLGRLLAELMPDESEVLSVVGLMLLHDSRREARVDEVGSLVLLPDQDRSRWDRAQIEEGMELVAKAWRMSAPGLYGLQAAIAAEHARSVDGSAPDWERIAKPVRAAGDGEPQPGGSPQPVGGGIDDGQK